MFNFEGIRILKLWPRGTRGLVHEPGELEAEFLVLLAGRGVEINIKTLFGELEGERPDSFAIVNIVRATKDAPEVGELKIR